MKCTVRNAVVFIFLAAVVCSSCRKTGYTGLGTSIYNPEYLNTSRFIKGPNVTGTDSIYINRKYDGCPTIEMTGDGILFSVHTGNTDTTQQGEGPGDFMVVSISPDSGRTWVNGKLLLVPGSKRDKYFDATIFRGANGKAMLCFAHTTDSLRWDGRGGVYVTELSYDRGADTIAYTRPRFLFDGVANNKPDLVDGQLYFAVSEWGPENWGNRIYTVPYAAFGTEEPRLLSRLPDAEAFSCEPSVTYLGADSEYIALLRVEGTGMAYTTSRDLKNWTGPRSYNGFIGDNASSRHCIRRLKSGHLLLIVNSSKFPDRSDISAFISVDNGKTWGHKFIIEGKGSYPDATEDDNGTIYIVYDRYRIWLRQIDVVKVSEDDILQNNLSAITKVNLNPIR